MLVFIFVLLGVILILAARRDWKTQQIPNIYPLCAMGVAVFGVCTGTVTLQSALIGAALGAVPMIIIHFVWHSVGWGDVKLMAACGAALGSMDAANLLIFSYIVMYAVYLVLRFQKKVDKAWAVAFSPFIAIGFGGVLMIHLLGVIVSGKI